MMIPGCIPRSAFNEEYVSGRVQERSGYKINSLPGESYSLPTGVVIEDGITMDEAIMLSLWNNPRFKADLSALGFARADLIDAGMLPNPVFSFLFPLGPKQMEFTLSYYAGVLWQRPSRVSAAKLNVEKIAENLVSNGLVTIRDVMINYAELEKLAEQAGILKEASEISNEFAFIAASRREAGDISELEETAFQLDASQAKEAYLNAVKLKELQKTLLLTNIGLITENSELYITPEPLPAVNISEFDTLVKRALAFRPDIRAAEIEVEMAGKKLGWEQSKILNLTAMLDANAQGSQGFEMGPGVALELPIFNTNQGGRSRARTGMILAADNYIMIQQQVTGEVRDAWYTYIASKETYQMISEHIIPAAEVAAVSGESVFNSGEISYLEYLNFRSQLLNAKLRLSAARKELWRSLAKLYYAVGGKLNLQ